LIDKTHAKPYGLHTVGAKMKLNSRVAIITGAGSGIGRGIAHRFAGEGAFVVVADMNSSACARVAEEIGELGMPSPTDVTSSEAVRALVHSVVKRFGKLDILVNNAGRTYQSLVIDMPEEEWDAVINVNLRGSFLCAKHAAPHLMKSSSGRIINIVTTQGGVPYASAYCASKMGLMALTQSLMYELAPYKVTVNAICPGTVRTTLSSKAIAMKAQLSGAQTPQIWDQVEQSIPLKRFCTATDVANVAAFLASDEAAFVTGALYPVTGGFYGHSIGSSNKTSSTPPPGPEET
jgi:NAD(P)-dependent dehydrogenase (short-subunit alcohol dehydrogenase family)